MQKKSFNWVSFLPYKTEDKNPILIFDSKQCVYIYYCNAMNICSPCVDRNFHDGRSLR